MSRRRPLMGTTVVLSSLFMTSAFLRIADGTGTDVIAMVRFATPAEAQTVGDRLPPDDEVATLLETLRQRQADLDSRALELDARSQAIRTAEDDLRASLEEMQLAGEELKRLLKMADEAAQQDLDRLARVYGAMRPDEAAALFEQMPPNFAAGFFGLLEPETAAPILAALQPESAYAISVMLAGRYSEVPR